MVYRCYRLDETTIYVVLKLQTLQQATLVLKSRKNYQFTMLKFGSVVLENLIYFCYLN